MVQILSHQVVYFVSKFPRVIHTIFQSLLVICLESLTSNISLPNTSFIMGL